MHQTTRPFLVRVLAVSDCAQFERTVCALLASATAEVAHAWTSATVADHDELDIIVFDRRVLAGGVGEMLRARRHFRHATIIVTSASNARDTAMLIDAGADDAIVVDDASLAARLNAAARRARTVRAHRYRRVGDIVFDVVSQSVTCGGVVQPLSRIEAALVRVLAESSPQPVSVASLILAAWEMPYSLGLHQTLRVYVGYLRAKLSSSTNVTITTQRGRGYAFTTNDLASGDAHRRFSTSGITL